MISNIIRHLDDHSLFFFSATLRVLFLIISDLINAFWRVILGSISPCSTWGAQHENTLKHSASQVHLLFEHACFVSERNVRKVVRTCEGDVDSAEVRCPSNTLISIDGAFFGRLLTSQGVLGVCASGVNNDDVHCYNEDTTIRIREECEDRESCSILPNNGFFGIDPCPGTSKYVFIIYSCTSKFGARWFMLCLFLCLLNIFISSKWFMLLHSRATVVVYKSYEFQLCFSNNMAVSHNAINVKPVPKWSLSFWPLSILRAFSPFSFLLSFCLSFLLSLQSSPTPDGDGMCTCMCFMSQIHAVTAIQ